jgi:hypothetical protein
LGLLLVCAAGLALLHVLRTDLSPVSDRLSEYANGSYGAIMTVSFFTLGAGMVVLGVGMRRDGMRHGWAGLVPLGVVAAGCGMVVSGLFPTDPAGASTTTERIHSLASGSATVMTIAAAGVSSFVVSAGPPRRSIGTPGALALAAIGLGVVSPILHETRWSGLSQRLLWLALLAWLLVTAWPPNEQTDPGATPAADSRSPHVATAERPSSRSPLV